MSSSFLWASSAGNKMAYLSCVVKGTVWSHATFGLNMKKVSEGNRSCLEKSGDREESRITDLIKEQTAWEGSNDPLSQPRASQNNGKVMLLVLFIRVQLETSGLVKIRAVELVTALRRGGTAGNGNKPAEINYWPFVFFSWTPTVLGAVMWSYDWEKGSIHSVLKSIRTLLVSCYQDTKKVSL